MSDLLRVALLVGGGCTDAGADHHPGRLHARGYLETGECELVAIAGLPVEAGVRFGDESAEVTHYEEYQDLLELERPDIVSICAGPRFQPTMVLDAASADVRAIHCELPLAPAWGEAKTMRKAAGQKGIQLTCNLASRLLPAVLAARELHRSGALGDLVRLEAECSDLLHQGVHYLDLFFVLNDESAATRVHGKLTGETRRTVLGVPVEDQGAFTVEFRNGVTAQLQTGATFEAAQSLRLVGSRGVIELCVGRNQLRYRKFSEAEWHVPREFAPDAWETATSQGIADLVQCLEEGGEPELSGERGLRATELVFAAYEAVRRGTWIELPLLTEDSAFLSMLEAGEIGRSGSES